FTQHYGSDGLDGALLLIPLVGFLPVQDPRVVRTIHAIRRDLDRGGLVLRYDSEARDNVDGLPPGEGVFLPCSFWLVDCLFLLGELDEARALFEHLLSLCSPLGLLAEEYDPVTQRLLGNFPQAFSHVTLVNSAHNLSGTLHPAEERSGERTTGERSRPRTK